MTLKCVCMFMCVCEGMFGGDYVFVHVFGEYGKDVCRVCLSVCDE